MKLAGWMTAASIASALAAVVVCGRRDAPEILAGMAGPLAAAAGSWIAAERAYRLDPSRLTGVMMGGFAAKMLFFGAYVAFGLRVMALRPVPFVASFTSYFIALYAIEALALRAMFAGREAGAPIDE
jgi:hypothetical protein